MKKGYALITGASSGIGYEIADILASKGYPLIIVARRTEQLEALQRELLSKYGKPVHVVTLDLSTLNAAAELYNHIHELNLDVELLVNNAGFGFQCNFINQSTDMIKDMIQLNVVTPTLLTKLFTPDFIKRGAGKILQVSSGSAYLPTPFVSVYAASKSYLRYFSEAIRYELRNQPVTITTLYPGYTKSEFGEIAQANVPWFIEYTQTSARLVATAAVKGMLQGKRSVIPGYFNKFSLLSASYLPRSLSVYFAGKVLGGKSLLSPP